MKPRFSGVFVTVKDHACVYTVCTEVVKSILFNQFYAPMYANGSMSMEEFDFVDFWNSEYDAEELEKIQSTLIDMMQTAGLYFKAPVPV